MVVEISKFIQDSNWLTILYSASFGKKFALANPTDVIVYVSYDSRPGFF